MRKILNILRRASFNRAFLLLPPSLFAVAYSLDSTSFCKDVPNVEVTSNSWKLCISRQLFPLFDSKTALTLNSKVIVLNTHAFREPLESKILTDLKEILIQNPDVSIYIANFEDQTTRKELETLSKSVIQYDTILLSKNSYEKRMRNIGINEYLQSGFLVDTYFKDLLKISPEVVNLYLQAARRMSSNETHLLYVFEEQEEGKFSEHLFWVKQMQISLKRLGMDNILIFPIQRQSALAAQLLQEPDCLTGSLHLLKKKNQFTFPDSNFHLTNPKNGEIVQFHLLKSVKFLNPEGHLSIDKSMALVDIFHSPQDTSFAKGCRLRIDRNKICEAKYRDLLSIFANIRRNQQFQGLKLSIQFGEVSYAGKDALQNKEWEIIFKDYEKSMNEHIAYDAKSAEQIANLGIIEEQYTRSSFTYRYEHKVVDEDLLHQFVNNANKGRLPLYFPSSPPNKLSSVHRLTGKDFQKTIIDTPFDHLVYEYSNHCGTCKTISPYINAFNMIVTRHEMPSMKTLKVHAFNSNANSSPAFPLSPFVPNIYFYKQAWSKFHPLRIPLEIIQGNAMVNLYQFCAITMQVSSIPWKTVDEHIERVKRDL